MEKPQRKTNLHSKDSFFILANYIKTNNYNLSFNDYKLIKQTQPLNNETGNIINDETKTILTAKKENLHEFFESSAPLPEEKRKRRLAPVLIVLLILMLGGAAYYWFYLKDNKTNYFTTTKIGDSSSNISVSNTSKEPEADTTELKISSSTQNKQPAVTNSTSENANTTNTDSTKYTVINKAWFHYEPDSTKLKPVFLNPRQDVVLTPKDEKNGFVYVIYVNSKGQATHGWLDKKDLAAVE